jgi:cell wall-associated NlpC family hydrolase
MTRKTFMHKKIIIFLFTVVICNAIFAETVTINVPVAPMYKQANADAPVISSAIYATSGEVVAKSGNSWLLVKTPDGYRGWMKASDVIFSAVAFGKNLVEVRNLFANIYQDPTTTNHEKLFTLSFSTRLPLIKVLNERWLMVRLANGDTGYVQQGDVVINPKPLTLQEMLALSTKFIGLPFTWGGVSSYGFDCSGFVQMLYKEMGILLPRDGGLQLNDPRLIAVDKTKLQPGDLLYFVQEGHIDHTGLYLGNNQFISSTPYRTPIVQLGSLADPHWGDIFYAARRLDSVGAIHESPLPEFHSTVESLPDNIKNQMQKYTWHEGCPVTLDDLVYIKLSYWGFDNRSHQGELVVRKDVATDVVAIFQDLYQQKFPLANMQLMDAYKGDDIAADNANNTSAFNCRPQVNFPKLFSGHSYGMAIDINPLINPYVNGAEVTPPASKKYLTSDALGKITKNDPAYQAFISRGWSWGGDWSGKIRDYQHFEKK